MRRSDGREGAAPGAVPEPPAGVVVADDLDYLADMLGVRGRGRGQALVADDFDDDLDRGDDRRPAAVLAGEEDRRPERRLAAVAADDDDGAGDGQEGEIIRRARRAPRRFGRFTGAGGIADLLLVSGAILFVCFILLRAWTFGAAFTIALFKSFGFDVSGWAVTLPRVDWTIPLMYALPLAVGAFQWYYCPYKFGRKTWWAKVLPMRDRRVPTNDWRFTVWWVLFILDIGSSFGGVWLYLEGRSFTLFAQLITISAAGWGLLLMIPLSALGSVICAYAPERIGRPAVAELVETWRTQIDYWRGLRRKPARA